MYQPQLKFSELIASMTNLNLRQTLVPIKFVNFLVAMQQHLGMQVGTGFYGFPYCAVPIYWGEITQQHQHQNQAPTPGPSHNQRSRGFHMPVAEPQELYNMNHMERSQEFVPPSIHAMPEWMPAKTQEPVKYGEPRQETHWWLTATPFQQMRSKPYDRYRSSRYRRKPKRTDDLDPSVYRIPTGECKNKLISLSIHCRPFNHQLFAGGAAMARGPYIPTPALAMLSTWTTPSAPGPSTPSSDASTSTVSGSSHKNAEKGTVISRWYENRR